VCRQVGGYRRLRSSSAGITAECCCAMDHCLSHTDRPGRPRAHKVKPVVPRLSGNPKRARAHLCRVGGRPSGEAGALKPPHSQEG
jgi:hypothetical protein